MQQSFVTYYSTSFNTNFDILYFDLLCIFRIHVYTNLKKVVGTKAGSIPNMHRVSANTFCFGDFVYGFQMIVEIRID